MRDYPAIAADYCSAVLAGKIPAGRLLKLACKRQVDDLRRWSKEGSPFHFDKGAASRVCKFIELLTHVKGELAGTRIRLEPWQVFILTTAFGWLDADGNRRFRRVYIEVARGNGKSALSSGVGLYCLCADKEPGAEVYSFATTRDQAKIVWGDAKAMTQANADLRKAFGLQVLANALYLPSSNSTFQAKSAEGSTLDGLNTHLAIIDELHAHKTRAVYDVVETSLGKRRNSLLWCITTAGFDLSGICYEVRGMVSAVLEGTAQDERQFGVIFTIDEGDDWRTDEALMKANPNWGVSVRPEVVKGLQAKAMLMAAAENNFKTKHLDVWCNANAAWMSMDKWDACADQGLSPDDFEGCPCWIGLDLANKRDLAAKVLVFAKTIDGKQHFAVFGDYYLPKKTVEESSNSQYSGWERDGLITATEGVVTDFNRIADDIRRDCARFDVREVRYDPWQANQLATTLAEEGVPMVEVRQTVQNLSDPMKQLEAYVFDKRLHHDGNACLRWQVSNVVAHVDAKDNIYPRKERPENKIDGVVATIIALSGAVLCAEAPAAFEEFLDNPLVFTYG